jgi:integrase
MGQQMILNRKEVNSPHERMHPAGQISLSLASRAKQYAHSEIERSDVEMKGYLQQRDEPGRTWRIQVYVGKDKDGKPQRHFETFHGKKADAQVKLRELLTSMDKGVFTPPGKMTVAELAKEWLDGHVKTRCSQRTHDGYESITRNHLGPALGSLKLKELTRSKIQGHYGKACQTLSERTVHHQHRVLSEIIKYGVRQGYLANNVCALCDPPRPRRKEMRALNPRETANLLEAGKESYYYPVIYTAVSSGLRQSELLGLRWCDVDLALDAASLSINQVLYKRRGTTIFKPPKTEKSRRRVRMTAKLALFLRGYRAERESMYLQTGRILSGDDLVFTSCHGEPLNPSVLSHNFHLIAAKAGLTGVRFHDMRHTFATLMLLRHADIKVVSEALGHASVAFTMDTYQHILEGMQEDAMMLLDEVLPPGVSPNYSNAKLTPAAPVMAGLLCILASSPCSSGG